ncbi:MAG: hypothetical protein AAGC60_13190 [Acidobacteriota bacterium]
MSRELIAMPGNPLKRVLDEYAAEKVAQLDEDEVLATLREQGISSLEDLVSASLDRARTGDLIGRGGSVAKDTFIFTQFIYKTEGPGLNNEILTNVANQLRRF